MPLNRCVEADLRDIAGLAPDTAIKASMTVKRVVIVFLLAEGLAFSLLESTAPVKHSKAGCAWSFEKCLWKSFAQSFELSCLVFLLSSFRSSLCVVDFNPISDL